MSKSIAQLFYPFRYPFVLDNGMHILEPIELPEVSDTLMRLYDPGLDTGMFAWVITTQPHQQAQMTNVAADKTGLH